MYLYNKDAYRSLYNNVLYKDINRKYGFLYRASLKDFWKMQLHYRDILGDDGQTDMPLYLTFPHYSFP